MKGKSEEYCSSAWWDIMSMCWNTLRGKKPKFIKPDAQMHNSPIPRWCRIPEKRKRGQRDGKMQTLSAQDPTQNKTWRGLSSPLLWYYHLSGKRMYTKINDNNLNPASLTFPKHVTSRNQRIFRASFLARCKEKERKKINRLQDQHTGSKAPTITRQRAKLIGIVDR